MSQSDLILPPDPKLSDYQRYVAKMVAARGFTDASTAETFLRLTEEVGELAKAIRKTEKMRMDAASKEHALDEEIADVFIYLLDICNRFDIDLETAFRDKEAVNKQRIWS